MKKRILLILAMMLVLYVFDANAELKVNAKNLFEYPSSISTKTLKNQDLILKAEKNAQPVILNINFAQQIFASNNEIIKIKDFPVSPSEKSSVTIKKSMSVLGSDTKFYLGTKNGKKEMPPVELYSYYGQIDGNPNSRVYLNYCGGVLFYIVEDGEGGSFNLTPVISTNDKESAHLLTNVINEDRKEGENPFICETKDYNGDQSEATDNYKHKDDILAPSVLLESELICEGTNEFFKKLGSNYNRAVAYMSAVIAVSSKIYQNDVNIKFKINTFLIWEDALTDPYTQDQLLSDKLQTMPSNWSSSPDKRSLVVLFAYLYAQPSGTIVAGISMGGEPNVGSICSKQRGYCVFGIHGDGKYPTTNYHWDVNCATHEMGHNFSAPHTHNCYFKPNMIDTCITINKPIDSDACLGGNPIPRLGTIMSYCHLTNSGYVELVFHPRNIKLMRTAAEKATCIKAPTIPILKLLNPLGEVTYNTGDTVQIRWVYSGVTTIGIKYTADNGLNWTLIKENINVKDSIHTWTVPKLISNQAKVWIYSMSDISIGDTSWNTFKIQAPYLNIKKPVAGNKYSQKVAISIEWDMLMTPSVDIDYSIDGGSNWLSITKNNTNQSYLWDVSSIASNNCKVRLTSASDANLVAETGIFAIGKETAAMLFPAGGEKWCGGYSYYINWTADFVDILNIEYTIDNGTTWTKVRTMPFVWPLNYYLWKLPSVNKTITNAKLRIYKSTDKDNIFGYSGEFIIDTCIQSAVNEQIIYPISSPVSILEISPNPVYSSANVKIYYNLSSFEPLNLSLYNVKGELISNIGKFNFSNLGEQEISINLPSVAQGQYYLELSGAGYRSVKSVQIAK